jgi:hypothetical protein
LIIAKIADGILSKMGIIETKNFKIWQSVEVQCFFEGTNLVASDVKISKTLKLIKGDAYLFDLIASNPKLL